MFKKIFTAGLLAISALSAYADEGMWVLHHIDARTQQVMQQLGLRLSAQELYDPESGVSLKDAVVDFGDFCSGVVVSPNGLVFTNHHCGYESIQQLSTTDDDILKNGFVAHSFAEERPAKGLSVFFLQRTDDITERVMAGLQKMRDSNPEIAEQMKGDGEVEALDFVLENIQSTLAEENPKLEVRVQSFYGNSKFYVSYYKEYKDIRLVFTPTETLGKFGGDTDNWMWPRQTSDFSVFRIYADKNGEPAEYSTENVPLHPKRWAKVSLDGYAPGDYCMTIGFPGSTDRYLSSYGIEERIERQNKPRIDIRGKKQDVWTKWMKADRSVGIKYAAKFAHSSNYWKNSIGMNQALEKLGVIAEKQQLEKTVQNWVATQPERTQNRFNGMLSNLKEGYDQRAEAMRSLMYYNEVLSGIEIAPLVNAASRFATSTDSAKASEAIQAMQAFYKDYDARVDEETTAVLLQALRDALSADLLPADLIKEVDEKWNGDFRAYVHNVFANTILTDPDKTFQKVAFEGIDAVKEDAAMQFFNYMADACRPIIKQYHGTLSATEYGEMLLTQALLEMQQDQPHYSDANFSMRLSYGIIQDYTADGQHFDYYTPSASILEKAARQTEIEDYKLEGSIIDLIKQRNFGRYADKRTGDLQLCFLSNNDITGGNSGSPMFNGKGELIGLAFDGNWEAMSGDILFNPALQRCIGVDIRFVLYLIDQWGHADNLIKELGL